MRIIYIKNNSDSVQTWIKEFAIAEEYQLQTTAEQEMYANCDDLLAAIGAEDALIGDGDSYFATIAEQIDWLVNIPDKMIIKDSDGTQANVIDGKLQTDSYITAATAGVTGKNANNFYPCPDILMIDSDVGEQDNMLLDSEGNLMVRAPVLTDEGSFRDDFSGSTLYTTLTGTLSFTNGGYSVTGSGTAFLSELSADHYIKKSAHAATYWTRIAHLISDTELTLLTPYGGATASGESQKCNWYAYTQGTAALSTSNSETVLSTGTSSDAVAVIYRELDYGPMRTVAKIKFSQRIANQLISFGYADGFSVQTKTAYFVCDGTTNTTIKCISQSSVAAADTETTTVTLPNGGVTSDYHIYTVDVKLDQCAFFIDGAQVAVHKTHVPGPYDSLKIGLIAANIASAASTTSLTCDYMYAYNLNQVEVQNTFNASPVFIAQQEDIHYLSGNITTTATTADQVIVSLAVPSGKTLYIVGYSIATDNIGGVVKIGKNTVTTPPAGPGTVDGVIFRTFKTSNYGTGNISREATDFSNPRRLGVYGDTVKITVTPAASTSSVWSASLDYILR